MEHPKEKILVGDDQLDYAKEHFPYIPGAEVRYVDNPYDVVMEVRHGDYTMLVTDLNYTKEGEEGIQILKALKSVDIRKILWTGNAHEEWVQARAKSLGVELLDKKEIGTLVGAVVSQAPIKKGGKILVYFPQRGPTFLAFQKVMETLIPSEEIDIIQQDLKSALESGGYGFVIDGSTIQMPGQKPSAHGTVAHDLKYIELEEIPKVLSVEATILDCVTHVLQLIAQCMKENKDYQSAD